MFIRYFLVLFGGTLGAFILIHSGVITVFRYELSVMGLVLSGWSYLIRLGCKIQLRGGNRELCIYVVKLLAILACGNAVDIMAIINGAWTFEAALNIRIGFRVASTGMPAVIPVLEAFGFNISIAGVIMLIIDCLGIKKWL